MILETLDKFKNLVNDKSLYFASDFHLGAPSKESSHDREIKICRWLDDISKDAAGIFLVGDIFDFWFEYKKVIPKGFIRFQYKLLELREKGQEIFIFSGNHDKWFFDYFPLEFGIPVFQKPICIEVGNHKILVGHGDGLGPSDHSYKILQKIFEGKIPQYIFRCLHPDLGVRLAQRWSSHSRISSSKKKYEFKSKEQEWLWQYAREIEKKEHFDYYIFGHRHIPLELEINKNAKYLNLGEWITQYTYVKYDGKTAEQLTYNS